MAVNSTGYSSSAPRNGPALGGAADSGDEDSGEYWTLSQCVDAYTTYILSKRNEIDEQQVARRYRHGAQWTDAQIKVLDARKQPVVTYNRLGRKIDGIVGLVEKLRQDPKAYPRTPQHQAGADLATAVLRYLMDTNHWQDKKALVAEKAAVDGLAGIEFDLKEVPESRYQQMGSDPLMISGQPDYDIAFEVVDNDGFFYDPRSYKHDFSDARYLGVGKWVDSELLKEMMPDKAELIDSSRDQGSDLSTDSDKDLRWFQNARAGGKFSQVRLVDIWYQHKGKWCWTLFTRGAILDEGQSPFYFADKQICKYLMFSAQVDHDGDRYGFPRNLMSAQDEINQRRSKALHLNNSRRIRAVKAAIADNNVEAMRREAARSDGIILSNTTIDDIQFDDAAKNQQLMAEIEFLKESKAEIENFGPNPALIGQTQGAGVAGSSGRAIALLQQAGIAELGPYMLNLRAWTLRVYRSLFQAAQKYWTNERWIRVTDNQGLEQFVKLNAMQFGPDGMPTMVNAIGELDVDIILDEGPDTITMQQDTYDAISQALPSVAKILSPQQAQAVMEVLIETSPLPADVKKKFRDAGQQQQQQGPPPEVMKMQAELQMEREKNAGQLQLQQQKAELDAQTKQATAAADIQISRQQAQNDMEIERMKATNKMQVERESAMHKAQIDHHNAEHQALLNERFQTHEEDLDVRKAKTDAAIKERDAKRKEEHDAKNKPVDHTPHILALIEKISARKVPVGIKRTKDGMQVVYEGDA